MRCFKNVLIADLNRFWNLSWKFYAMFFAFCILQTSLFYSNMYKLIHKMKIVSVSLGEALMSFFRGAKEFYPNGNTPIDVPVFELLMLLYLLFIIAYYVNKDRSALGRSIMLASRSPIYWWISKCITTLIADLVYMFIIVITHIACGWIILGRHFTCRMAFTSEVNIRYLLISENIKCDTNITLMTVMILLSLITASLIMLLMAYLSNAVFGFIINLVIFIISICYMQWFFIYNYMMMCRIHHVYNQWKWGAGLIIIINIAIIGVGIIYSRRKDFL